MAKKNPSTYLHNAKMSLRNLGIDIVESTFPNTKNLGSDLKSGYEAVRRSSTGGASFNTIKSKIKSMPLIKFTNDITSSFFQAVKTGKFYQSADELYGLDFDFDDFEEDTQYFMGDEDTTDSKIPVAREPGSSTASSTTNAKIMGEAHVQVGKQISASNRSSSLATLEALEATAMSINNAIVASASDLKAQLIKSDLTLTSMREGLSESVRIQNESLKVQTELLVEQKAFAAYMRDYHEIKEKQDESRNTNQAWYESMKKGDFMQAFKEMSTRATNAVDQQKSQGVFQMMSSAIPLIMMMTGGNPFALVKNFWLDDWMNRNLGLGDFAGRLDSKMKSLPDMIEGGARTMSLSENDIIRAIGDAVRNQTDLSKTISTDKYEKGRKFWDGTDHEALTNVIPTYLSSIVSLLSGNERTVYDYNKGVFRGMTETKDIFYQNMPKLKYEYEDLTDLMIRNMPEEQKANTDTKRLEQFNKLIMERLAERGYTLSNFKDTSYERAKDILAVGDDDMSESDFLMMRSMLSELENNENSYIQFRNMDRSMARYIRDFNDYMKKASTDARKSGVIATINKSGLLDNNAAIGLRGLAGGQAGVDGTIPGGYEYKHLMNDFGKVNLNTTEGRLDGSNIFGNTLSPEEIQIINDYTKDNLGGIKRLGGSFSHQAKLILQSKMFKKMGFQDEEWFQRYVQSSDYDINKIIEQDRFLDSLINSSIQEEEMRARLDILGVREEDASRILEIMTMPDNQISENDRRAEIKLALSRTDVIGDLKETLSSKVNSIKSKIDSVKSDYTSGGEKRNKIVDKISEIKGKGIDQAKTIKEFLNEKWQDAKGTVGGFYNDNKETIQNIAKASLGAGAGYAFLKTLGKTGIFQVAAGFGMLAPVALGAGALGAGIYAYKNNVFDNLFGDPEKAKATKEKALSIAKTGLIGAGVAGGMSGVLSMVSGGALGMMGLPALALTGLGIGVLGEIPQVKEFFFGTSEGSFASNFKGWFFGDKEKGTEGVVTKAGAKIKKFFNSSAFKVGEFFKKDIWAPVSESFKPISDFVSNTTNKVITAISGMPTKLEDGILKNLKTNMFEPIIAGFRTKIIDPMGNFLSKTFSSVFGMLGKIVSAPFKFFRTLVTGKDDRASFSTRYNIGGDASDEYGAYQKSKYMTPEEAKSSLTPEEYSRYSRFNLFDANKDKSLNDESLRENLSKSELKQLRKMRAGRYGSQEDTEESNEFGQGVSDRTARRYFTSQNSLDFKSMTMGSGFSISTHGCGLVALSQGLSILLDEPVKVEDIVSTTKGYASDKGVSPAFMIHTAHKYSINASSVSKVNKSAIEKHLDKNGVVVIEMWDFETNLLHYVLVTDYTKGEFVYSDPARQANMKVSKSSLISRTRTAIFMFKPKFSSGSISEPTSSKEENVVTGTTSQESTRTGSVSSQINKSDTQGSSSSSNLTRTAASGANVKDTELFKIVRTFYLENTYQFKQLRSELSLNLKGVAYNSEYIKRLLAKEYGEIEGFGDQDITNQSVGGIRERLKMFGRFVGHKASAAVDWVYDHTIGPIINTVNSMKDKLMAGIQKIKDIPMNIIKGVKDAFLTILPSKETMGKIISGIGTTIKTGVEWVGKSVYNVAKLAGSAISSTVDKLGNMIAYGTDKLMEFAGKGISTVANGMEWIITKSANALAWVTEKAWGVVKEVGSAVWGGIKSVGRGVATGAEALKDMIAPKKVYVVGGHLNTVQRVEVVKAVGAVDLDYAESLDRKLKSPAQNTIDSNLNKGKPINRLLNFISPKFKSGAEYNLISDRQDAENNLIVQNSELVEGKEKGGGMLSSLISSVLGDGLLGKGAGFLAGALGTGLSAAGGVIGTMMTAIAPALPYIAAAVAIGGAIYYVYNKVQSGEWSWDNMQNYFKESKAKKDVEKKKQADQIAKQDDEIVAKAKTGAELTDQEKHQLKNAERRVNEKTRVNATVQAKRDRLEELRRQKEAGTYKAGLFYDELATLEKEIANLDAFEEKQRLKDAQNAKIISDAEIRDKAKANKSSIVGSGGINASKLLLGSLSGFGPMDGNPLGENAGLFDRAVNRGLLDRIKGLFSSKREEDNIIGPSFTDWVPGSGGRSTPERTFVNIKPGDKNLAKIMERSSDLKTMYNYARNSYGDDIAKNFMRIAYAESTWNPKAFNANTNARGLFQVLDKYRDAWGFKSTENPHDFSPVDQLRRVAPKLLANVQRLGGQPTLADMYAALHYPAAVGKPDDWALYSVGSKAYQYNKGLDYDKDGSVRYSEMSRFVHKSGDRADAYARALGMPGFDGGDMSFVSQKSSKYNHLPMGALPFKNAGCGPAVAAMLLDKLGIKYDMSYLVSKANGMMKNPLDGTPMIYFKEILEEHGISSNVYIDNIANRFMAELREGKSPILLTTSSTGSGHYIIGREIEGDRITINDPEKSNSETVSKADRRLREAKAILVYADPNANKGLTGEGILALMNTGKGSFDGISDILNGGVNTGINRIGNDISGMVNNKISNGKYDIVGRISDRVLNENISSARNSANQILSPLQTILGGISSAESQVRGTIDRGSQTIYDLANTPNRAAQTGQNAVNQIKNQIGNMLDISGPLNSLKQSISEFSNIAKTGIHIAGSPDLTQMKNDLSEIKDLMKVLVKFFTGEGETVINGRRLYETQGGRVMNARSLSGNYNSGGDDFQNMIYNIAKGPR